MGFENLMQTAAAIRSKAIEIGKNEIQESDEIPKEWVEAWRADVERKANAVAGKFQPFTELPDPAKFNGAIAELQRVMGKLSSGQDTSDPISRNGRVYPANVAMTKMDSVKGDVQGWSGRAAQEFITKFLTPFPAVMHNQFLLVAALKSALEAEQAMFKAAREDIASIAEATLKYLESMRGCSKNQAVIVFTVIASICAVLTSSGGALPIAITAIGAVASAGADIVGLESAPKTQIDGMYVVMVLASMEKAINQLVEKIMYTENRIKSAVANISDQIHSAQSSSNPDQHSFCARRPSLADASRGSIRHDLGYTG